MPEISAAQPPRLEPSHPGAILREDVLPALGLGVSEAARLLRVSRQTLHSILAERSAISPEMAVRLGRFCGNGGGCGSACSRSTTCGTRSGSSTTRWSRSRGTRRADPRFAAWTRLQGWEESTEGEPRGVRALSPLARSLKASCRFSA